MRFSMGRGWHWSIKPSTVKMGVALDHEPPLEKAFVTRFFSRATPLELGSQWVREGAFQPHSE